jgi:transcriptional regulator with PAS, ATPase and Fis domain
MEDRIYRKVGGTEYLSTEARFIVATNVDLYEEVKQGRFRSDLYYRLSVLDLKLPALRERKGDILELANYFIQKFNGKFEKNIRPLDRGKLKELLAFEWPGNIRELRNFIEKQMVFTEGASIDLSELEQRVKLVHEVELDYKRYMEQKEREFILNVYEQGNQKVETVAEVIGMSVPFVYKKLKEHGIS